MTVISSLQQLTVVGASTTQGHALAIGEERKLAAHAEACRSVGVTFIPLVAESIGGWSDWAEETIRDIGRLQGQRLGIPPADATSHLFQRLAICLWRGNAALWIRRMLIRPSSVDGIEYTTRPKSLEKHLTVICFQGFIKLLYNVSTCETLTFHR